MIKFGIRQSFDNIEQVEERYSKLDVPVELALPYYWDIYEPVRGRLAEVAEKIRSCGTKVLSVHAVQAPITDERFKIWGNEIASFNLPMTLDISHIREDEKVWSLIKGYKERIFNVHLSAREGTRQHLPVDDFCKEVARYLIDNKWTGNVILEYLPEFHGHLINDLELLKAMQ